MNTINLYKSDKQRISKNFIFQHQNTSEVLSISITKLKEWGYLEPNEFKSGTITWSRNGNKTGSISITSNIFSDNPYIELDYNFRDESQKYRIQLVTIPSNIGNGMIWYFICPYTGKKCRKLYLIGKYFLHREAANGYLYEKQTYSKKDRFRNRMYDYLNAPEHIYKPYFKTIKGKATKKYLKYMNQIRQTRGVTLEQLIVK